ncbi:MAG TPA: NAD(P)-binding domain-containing protein [Streptosporangiaceae bacterium]
MNESHLPRRIGIIGTGRVAQTLAGAWGSAGHTVVLGSRTPAGGTVSLDQAVTGADVVVNATPGRVSVEALSAVNPDAWDGTVLIDLANAVTPAFGLVYPDGSLAERLQAALPNTRVVKSLNTAAMTVLANPASLGPASVFVSGDDPGAKAVVAALLRDLGWTDDGIIDLGPLSSARAAEHFFLMFAALMQVRGRDFNVRVVGPAAS